MASSTAPQPGQPADGGAAEDAMSATGRALRAHGVGVRGGISGNRVAQRAGVSAETVNRLLRPLPPGKRPPGMDKETMDAVADAVPMSRLELQSAVLVDAGFIEVAYGAPGEGVEGVLARLHGLSDHDRRIVLAELAGLLSADDLTGER